MIILARSLLEWKRLVILPCDSGISEIELVSPPDNCLLYFFSSSPIPLHGPFALWFSTLAVGPINETKPGCNVPVGQGSFFDSM